MRKFHVNMATLDTPTCSTCSERFPGLHFHSTSNECLRGPPWGSGCLTQNANCALINFIPTFSLMQFVNYIYFTCASLSFLYQWLDSMILKEHHRVPDMSELLLPFVTNVADIWWKVSDWALHNTYYPSMWYSTTRSGSPQDVLHLH